MMRTTLALLFLAASLPAQGPTFMQLGNVVHGYGGPSAALLDTGLQTVTPIQLVPGGLSANAFTWDRDHPDDLVCWASDSRLYRTTVAAAGTTHVQLGTQQFGGVQGIVQMSWDQAGDLIVVGNPGFGQIHRVDPTTGAVATLLDWPFPSSVTCGRQDPVTGDFWVGGPQGVWRVSGVPAGSPSVTLVHPTPSSVQSLTFDPLKPEFLVFTRSGDVHRLNVQTLQEETVLDAPFSFSFIRTSETGDLVAARGRDVYRIPNLPVIPAGGVTPILLGTNPSVGCCNNSDLVVIGNTFTPFRLDITPLAGGAGTIEVSNPPPGLTSSWMFLSATTVFAAGSGPFLGIVPDGLTLSLIQAFPTPQPGNPLHSLGPPPALVPLPPGSMSVFTGQTWDGVVAAFGPAGAWLGRTNVERVTWQ